MALSSLLCATVLLPGLVFAVLGLAWLLGWEARERLVARLTSLCFTLSGLAVAGLSAGMVARDVRRVAVDLGAWFQVEHHHFPLMLVVDRLSLPFLALSVILVGIVAVFSVRYMHREPGFLRFFVLLNLFGFGILLLFAAGSFDLLVVGWELVGLTSVLLIAFFHERREPVQNALRVFAVYRACDIGLLTGVVLIHRQAGTTLYTELFREAWPAADGPLSGQPVTLLGLFLLLAAMGKAAQVPFSGWLPRAMEGPTPSSAIFYGALSVHAGAYLLLRAQPILAGSRLVSAAVVGVGLLTALYGTMAGRVAADAKSSLAHASTTQLGLIFMEVGLGWHWLAVLHVCGHATVRTLEFLRAPSMLHDFHQLHSAAGGHLPKPGAHFEMLLPVPLRSWLYRLALDRGHLDTLLDRFAVAPLLRVAALFSRFEDRWIERAFGPNRIRRHITARRAGLSSTNPKPESANA